LDTLYTQKLCVYFKEDVKNEREELLKELTRQLRAVSYELRGLWLLAIGCWLFALYCRLTPEHGALILFKAILTTDDKLFLDRSLLCLWRWKQRQSWLCDL